MSPSIMYLWVFALLSTVSTPVAAQIASQPTLVAKMALAHPKNPSPAQSEYDRGALRFESHRWTIRVLRGTDEVVVGRTQWFRPFDLASIVAPSEQAQYEAREFNRNRTPGMWGLTFGVLTIVGGTIAAQTAHHPTPLTSVAGIAGTWLLIYGAERLDRASEALSRSLWWYNRDLKARDDARTGQR